MISQKAMALKSLIGAGPTDVITRAELPVELSMIGLNGTCISLPSVLPFKNRAYFAFSLWMDIIGVP
jgi:hypothetical protein